VDLGDAGIWCNAGWCWEYPRPVGADIETVAARGTDDVWIAADYGYAGHWNGQAWISHPVPPRFTPSSLCFAGSDLYLAGSDADGIASLYRFTTDHWAPVTGFMNPVLQLRCTNDGLLLAMGAQGAARYAPDAGIKTLPVTPGPGMNCSGITERADGGCSVACIFDGPPKASTVYACDGTREFPSDGGTMSVASFGHMWLDARGPMAADFTGTVWFSPDRDWIPFWQPGINFTAGAAFSGGSFAVGDGWGTLPNPGMTVQEGPSGTFTLYDVAVDPGGTAFGVGGEGTILRRDPDAGFTFVSQYERQYHDISVGTRILAAADDGTVLERIDGGWQLTSFNATQLLIGVWERPDTSFAVNSATRITFENETTVLLHASSNGPLAILDDTTAFEATDDGLFRVDMVGNNLTREIDAGIVGVCSNGSGQVYAASPNTVWVSGGDGGWSPMANSPPQLAALSCGGGGIWAAAGTFAWYSDGGTWQNINVGHTVGDVVAIDPTHGLVFQGHQAWSVTPGMVLGLTDMPGITVIHARAFGGQVWIAGDPGAIVRYVP
jgi:hypothetical protein